MYSNQLIQLLQTFSRKEMTRLFEFAHSPYFNKHKGVRALIAYLSSTFPDFSKSNCDRNLLAEQIFTDKILTQQELAIIFTYSLRLAEQFLTNEQFKKDHHFQKLLLLRQLRKREQYQHYEKINQKLQLQLDTHPIKDADYFNLQFLKAAESDQYYSDRSRHEKDHSIQQKQNNLDQYYLAVKLRDSCEMLVRSRIMKIDYSTDLLDILLAAIREQPERYAKNPMVTVYFQIFQMIRDGEQAFYYDALSVVQSNSDFFTIAELQNIYTYLQNFCIEQINKGYSQFLQEAFILYKDQLDKKLLLDINGFLSQWHYKNIVTTSIRLGEMDWTYDFIEGYKEKLNPEVIENAYTYNLAAYYYSSKQLEKVLELLVRVEYTDIRYNLAAKSLLLRTYYDLNADEALSSLTRSFSQYLSRNKLIRERRKQAMSNLVRFTNRAFQIKSNLEFVSREKSEKELTKLENDMTEMTTIINKDWLDQKIDELKQVIR